MRNRMLSTSGVLALAAMVFAGCARNRQPEAPVPMTTPVTVEVQNNNWNTVVVYAIAHGVSQRLGEVNTGRTQSLTTPAGVDPTSGDFKIVIDPIGSRFTFATGNLMVSPGGTVSLTVENDLNLSSWTIS